MNSVKILMTALCAAFMVFGVMTTAIAVPITLTPGDADWTWVSPNPSPFPDHRYNNPDEAVVSWVTGKLNVTELYKQNQGGSESGAYAGSYTTEFLNEPTDPKDAIITYVSGEPFIGSTPVYLLVKDGNHDPIWYLFELKDWDGKETMYLNDFWPGRGAISHITIFDPPPTNRVPEPTTMLLLGLGLMGLAGLRRKFQP